MNRSNVGNVITNGTQILSVGATTASKLWKKPQFDKADTVLNSNSLDSNQSIQNNATEEQNTSIKTNSYLSMYKENSEEVSNIKQKIERDFDWIETRKKIGKAIEENPIDKIIKELKVKHSKPMA